MIRNYKNRIAGYVEMLHNRKHEVNKILQVHKLLFFTFLLISGKNFSQVGIGTSTPHADALLDFATGINCGIILPMVETLPTGSAATNGTFLIDRNDGKVKVRQNDSWIDLTGGNTNLLNSLYDFNTSADVGNGVILGATSSAASGVLVLESNHKGLMLPRLASPHLNIKSPYPGLLCYDTDKNQIAIFNGQGWYYWK